MPIFFCNENLQLTLMQSKSAATIKLFFLSLLGDASFDPSRFGEQQQQQQFSCNEINVFDDRRLHDCL